eukprot:COSAG05_NODE_2612_length_2837_cov_2.529584_3_plen_264_part_00
MEHFASFDTDGDGLIGFLEFTQLWEHLGQPLPDAAATPPPSEAGADTGADAAAHPLAQTFEKYDLNGDGLLDASELGQMLVSLGFKPDPDYIAEMIRTFGAFDGNGDGQLDVREFEPLWTHIGGAETLAAAGADGAATGTRARTATQDLRGSVSQGTRANPLYVRFLEFDQNNKGWMSQFDVRQMMVRPHCPRLSSASSSSPASPAAPASSPAFAAFSAAADVCCCGALLLYCALLRAAAAATTRLQDQRRLPPEPHGALRNL